MFEYDPDKSTANKAKHGIDFDEAQALWLDDRRIEIAARLGEGGEARWIVVGRMGGQRRYWTVVITYRGDAIRIISARRSRRDEEQIYDETNDDGRI